MPSPAASATDALAILARRVGQKWSKSVIVENNPRAIFTSAATLAFGTWLGRRRHRILWAVGS